MSIKLYNTYTRKEETFVPLKRGKVGLYTCGLTVYDYAHIGNLRTYIFEDVLRRVLEFNGYKVYHVQNITDVGHLTSDADTGEDKVERAARLEHKSAWKISQYYTKTFKDDMKKLNILAPHVWCKATEHIPEQIELIKILEKKGYTYRTSDGIYFDSRKLKNYGQLARLDLKGLKAGARIAMREKKCPTDFALWKFSDPEKQRQMEWPSPWGVGFPGWHIECSTMSRKYLGDQFDVHCGGVDHIGVHHTNEIAQSQAATKQLPARYWLHGEMLRVEGDKMAKSMGNFYTLRDLEKKGFNPLAFRYLALMTFYRQKMNFTWEALLAGQKGLAQIYGFLYNMFLEQRGQSKKSYPGFQTYLRKKKEEFREAVNDDLNIPQALAVMFTLMHDSNEILWKERLSKGNTKELERLFLEFDQVLGLKFARYLEKGKKAEIPQEIKKLVSYRVSLRQQGKFREADELRQKIEKRGYQIEDTVHGPLIKRGPIFPIDR